MGELKDVLNSIHSHTTVENHDRYRNLSIGRGEVLIANQKKTTTIWIVNNEFISTSTPVKDITGSVVTTSSNGIKGEYSEPGTVAIPKNREPAATLLQEYEGPHSKVFVNGNKCHFIIKNSAHYSNSNGSVSNVYVGIAGNNNWTIFASLKQAVDSLRRLDDDIIRKQAAEEQAKKKAEELRRKQEEEARRLAAEEAKRLEDEAKQAEEEARKLNSEIEAAKTERENILTELKNAQAFIRNQVSLRNNPVLDKSQNAAKFSHIYDGAAVVINGGPGTGKTTTMIQRLKLLIDKGDLENYILNHDDCKLAKEQIDIISSTTDNWIYFSPNELLKKYLQDNMNYEGLTDTNHRTAVWKDFLKNAVRDEYHLAGQDSPFDFVAPKKADRNIFVGNHYAIIENFTNYFIAQVKERFVKILQIDTNKFNWKILGNIIKKECELIEAVTTLDELLWFLLHLENVDKRNIIDGKRLPSGSDIATEFNENTRKLADKYAALLKRDEVKYNDVIEFLKSQVKNAQQETDENEEGEEEEPDYGDLSMKLFNKLNQLVKKLALQKVDSSARLTGTQKQFLELVKDYIDIEEIVALADSAYFVKNLNPALKAFTSFLLTPIPQYYKRYRKSMPEPDRANWDQELLSEMVDTYKNGRLLSQEQALLVGFINNIAQSLYRRKRDKFESTNHKYITAYKNLCRPVIGVDEATDYSIIDFYGIKSFGHYAVCSYTLCGDTMQLMKEDGITDWNVLRNPLLFDSLDIHNLNVSYRQTEELLNLADKIYQEERGVKSPYECFLKGNNKTPKPLWLELDDIDGKAEWISKRVLEIVRAYDNKMPTIAVFTDSKDKADKLKEALEDCDILNPAGIEVKVCSDSNLEGEKTLRIFQINQVKGMEFEAVFFYDIDDIESSSLINKYLYVGLSRASMYLAVTSNGRSEKISGMLRKYFSQDSGWA